MGKSLHYPPSLMRVLWILCYFQLHPMFMMHCCIFNKQLQFWGDHEWRSSKLQTRTHTLFQPIVQIMQRGQWKPVERPSLKMWNFFFNWSLTSPDASWKGLTIFVRVIFEYCYSSCKQIEQSGSITKKCFDIWKLWNQMQFHILYTCYSCEKLISKC